MFNYNYDHPEQYNLIQYYRKLRKSDRKRNNRILTALQAIDKQVAVSYSFGGKIHVCSQEQPASVPMAFVEQLNETY